MDNSDVYQGNQESNMKNYQVVKEKLENADPLDLAEFAKYDSQYHNTGSDEEVTSAAGGESKNSSGSKTGGRRKTKRRKRRRRRRKKSRKRKTRW